MKVTADVRTVTVHNLPTRPLLEGKDTETGPLTVVCGDYNANTLVSQNGGYQLPSCYRRIRTETGGRTADRDPRPSAVKTENLCL